MQTLIVLATAVLALLSFVVAVVVLVFGDRLFASRLAALAPAGTAVGRAAGLPPRLSGLLETLGARLGRGAVDGEKRGLLRARLIQAGIYGERAVEAFYAVRVLTALGCGLVAAALVALLSPPGKLVGLLAVMAALNLGLFLPNLVLARRIAGRAEAMKLGLPDALDLMVVCMEAGSTVTAAMQRVAREFGTVHPALAGEFEMTLQQMQAGSSRADALTRMTQRAPLEDLRAMVTMLIQSEQLGASLGHTLRVFAEEMRRSRFLEAERKAGELPVKMAFPLVFFVFPCLMGVIFTPVVIRFIRVLFAMD